MRKMHSAFEALAITHANVWDPSIAIASVRAGYQGIFDLEFASDEAAAAEVLSRLQRLARGPFGLKLRGDNGALIRGLGGELLSSITLFIITPAEKGLLTELVRELRAAGAPSARILLEAVSVEEAELAAAVDADGVIAKGSEAGGRVGNETCFVLLQRMLRSVSLPVYAQGGIGPHTAAAAYVAGAAGVVLDSQLLLTREATPSEGLRQAVLRMDGSETACLGEGLGQGYRVFARRDHQPAKELTHLAEALAREGPQGDGADRWIAAVRGAVRPQQPEHSVWLLGQDAALAKRLAPDGQSVKDVIDGLLHAVDRHVAGAKTVRPLAPQSALARSHGTTYPIVQGPMTRVSDRSDFAVKVAEGGGLPFLALALMPAPEVEALLRQMEPALHGLPWGVGILGFVPEELRQQQMEMVRRYRPDFALIAGGRPDQAMLLEKDGIPTYLHVPSPGLLGLFVEAGARRFVFEGQECGGHIGPRSSFVLWSQAIDLLSELVTAETAGEYHLLFAGGIHDEISAAMVAAAAGELAARGCKIGVLMGTAYTVTEEAASAGAVVAGFQKAAISCRKTAVLESGPGHVTRCAETAIVGDFLAEKLRLAAAGLDPEQIKDKLEHFNIGRLRIATKGITRNPDYGKAPGADKFLSLDQERQAADGLFMLGQVAALRDRVTTIAELHENVSHAGSARLEAALPLKEEAPPKMIAQPSEVAITGMGCLLPKAGDLTTYWENILDKVNAITEVPEDRWDWRTYFDADRNARDKIYSKWGGFLDDIPFDPVRYGIPPNTVSSIEPLHLLTLEVVRAALIDAGFKDGVVSDPDLRSRTSVILGVGGGTGALGQRYAVRSSLPALMESPPEEVFEVLPEWTEDSFPGVLLNVTAGRVANRFDFGGTNFTVDAACGSSLAAVMLGVRELETGASDMVIVGGADAFQNPFDYVAFSKTRALSARGRCATFDAEADGIAISEGVAILVLRRLRDAECEGRRIYAVIQASAGSSDGRDKCLTAPRPEGQRLALERTYGKAGISPASVQLIEAHGTGTVVGDRTEVGTLMDVFDAAGARRQGCGIGSVKSMIGHTKCTAGTAGLIKVVLALAHKVLPPTLNVEHPNPEANFPESPFYILGEARPWIAPLDGQPRRAGVSAFGFGGTNFHVVVEEYDGNFLAADAEAPRQNWPSELLLWSAPTRTALLEKLDAIAAGLSGDHPPPLRDLAFSLWSDYCAEDPSRLAVVAASVPDLLDRIVSLRQAAASGAIDKLPENCHLKTVDPRGVYLSENAPALDGGIAFLFPGQGSQYPNMLGDLAIHFPAVGEAFAFANGVLAEEIPEGLSSYVFPPPAFSEADARGQRQALTRTDVAQPALGAASTAMLRLLTDFGLRADMAGGHSYGEYVALHYAGVFDRRTLLQLSRQRGRCMIGAAGDDLGTMASVTASSEALQAHLEKLPGVQIANRNAPDQTVIAGPCADVERAVALLGESGLSAKPIPVGCGFHSSCVAPARDSFAAVLEQASFAAPVLPVFANSTGKAYPEDPTAIRAVLCDHLVNPVNFLDQVEAMHDAGARVFVEVGAGMVLSGLVRRILGDRPHIAVASDSKDRSGVTQLQHLLGQLTLLGVPLTLDKLWAGRKARRLDLKKPLAVAEANELPATTWFINGGNARPKSQPKQPRRPVACATAPVAPGPARSANGEAKGWHGDADRAAVAARAPGANGGAGVPLGVSAPSRPVGTAGGTVEAPVAAHATLRNKRANLSDPAADQAILQHQQLMTRFLETQQQVMLAYLGSGARRPSIGNAPMRAGLAAEPVKPVAPAVADATPAVAPATAAVPAAATVPTPSLHADPSGGAEPGGHPQRLDRDSITAGLLELVSERTGYPPDMLDLDLNIEADLGIDSIKRVEILGTYRQRFIPETTDAVRSAMEQVVRQKTLRSIIDEFMTVLGGFTSAAPAAATNGTQPASAAAAEALALDRDSITAGLLELVSERTGYPPDMLDLDLNIEADLGIDSIKRVEILGSYRKRFIPETTDEVRAAMEQVVRQKTLRSIIDEFMAVISGPVGRSVNGHSFEASPGGDANGQSNGHATSTGANGSEPADEPRFVMVPVAAPDLTEALEVEPGCLYLVTDDEGGVAERLAAVLRERGGRAVLLRDGAAFETSGEDGFVVNFTDLEAVRALRGEIMGEHAKLGGIFHCLSLQHTQPYHSLSPEQWRNEIQASVKSLFNLAVAFDEDLRLAQQTERAAVVLAATRLGGAFGFATDGRTPPNVVHGGVAGLLKTLAKEWPGVRCRCVDFDMTPAPAEMARRLIDEAGRQDGEVEVGYQGDQRVFLEAQPAPLGMAAEERISIDSDSVILVTGGARGITAEITRYLAETYRPKLVICGSSPLSAEAEAPEIQDLQDARSLKAALIERAKQRGEPLQPAVVEASYRRIMKDREIRRTLAAVEAAGARVEYRPVDVRNAEAFGDLIDRIYADYGRLDGVIHGAGIIEDKLIGDKTSESFDRVVDTKTLSALTLSRKLHPGDLRFLVFFTSVAGRFGNRGQSDYGAANEIVAKLAGDLNRNWPARVLAISWGPWDKAGMVSDEVKAQFSAQGIVAIDPRLGRVALDRELRFGPKNDGELVWGEGPWACRAAPGVMPSPAVHRTTQAETAWQAAGS